MKLGRLAKNLKAARLSLRGKLVASLLLICAILLISSIISLLEFVSMRDYVSELIADDISSINVAHELADMGNDYNLEILALIGDENSHELPAFDFEGFKSKCDTLRSIGVLNNMKPLADSVMYSYAAYMLTSAELTDVLESDFIDTRTWYFERLQPRFKRMRSDIHNLTGFIYSDLEKNSATFERGFYRSVIPGLVAVGMGIFLIVIFLLFVMSYYVKPIYKMLDSLVNYMHFDKKYSYDFDGDDQLKELNDNIKELAEENYRLRQRIRTVAQKETVEKEQGR